MSPVHAAVLPRAHGRPVPHLRAAELDHPRPERRLSHISVIVIQFLNYLLDQKLLLQLDPVAVLQLDDPVILHQAGAAVAVVGGPVDVRAAIFNRLYLCITLLTIITCCMLHHLRRSSEIGRMLEAAALLLLGSAVSWSGVVWPGEVEMLGT